MKTYFATLLSKVKKFIRADKTIVNDPVLDDLQKFLRFFYCWPEQTRFHWRKILNWIQALVIQWIPSLIFLCRTDDFQLGMNTFCEMAGLELYLIQSALMTYHQAELSYLIDRIRGFWYRLARERPLGWEEVNKQHQKFISKATLYCISAFFIVGLIYVHFSAIWSFSAKYRGSNEKVSFGMHYHFFNETLTHKIYTDWNYIIPVYLVFATSFAVFVANYASVGFFFPFMTKQVAMSFKSIRIRINSLGRHAKEMNSSEVKKCLKHIIEEHNEAIGFAEDLETAFNQVYFFKSGIASVFLCFILFSIFIIGPLTYEIITVFLFGIVTQMELFTNFKIGDTLTCESEKIADAAYNFPWYECDKQVANMILLIIGEAQRPIELTSGKFQPISIYSYGRILNAAYSYLTFLKAMYVQH